MKWHMHDIQKICEMKKIEMGPRDDSNQSFVN